MRTGRGRENVSFPVEESIENREVFKEQFMRQFGVTPRRTNLVEDRPRLSGRFHGMLAA